MLLRDESHSNTQPSGVFEKSVTDEVSDLIVHRTNKYAEICINSESSTRSYRVRLWHPTDHDGIDNFLGIVMCMGLVWEQDIHLYRSR